MEIRLAPPCKRCGQPYLSGSNGICATCHTRQRRSSTATRAPRPPRCACGKPAVAIILAEVGYDVTYTVRLAVCAACLRLEQELEAPCLDLLGGARATPRLPGGVLRRQDDSWLRVDWP
jgi:hypothetical protein